MHDGSSSQYMAISLSALREYRKEGFSQLNPESLISQAGMKLLNSLISAPSYSNQPEYQATFKFVMESYTTDERNAIVDLAERLELHALVDAIDACFFRHRPQR